jgi:ATP-dependent DNA helicase RecG
LPGADPSLSAALLFRGDIYMHPMNVTSATEITYLKGVGPQRAAAFAKRGIHTAGDLLAYLPFRYEDRIHFSKIKEIVPGGTYTIQGTVADAGVSRFTRGRGAIYHLLVRDATGTLPSKFFHGAYLQGKFREGQRIVVHGKADLDPLRAARIEMVNPQYELLGAEIPDSAPDSTEVGRIVPIYEAIGVVSSRMIRRIVHTVLENLGSTSLDPLPSEILERYAFPARRDALRFVHFPPSDVPLETLNAFRSPAHQRLIFEEFFFYQLSLALRRQQAERQPGFAFRVREPRIREALKRILPFKPTDAQKRVLAEIAADLERPVPMNRLLEGDVGSGKTIVALEAATIVMENGFQVALMAPTEILAVQHFLSARRIFGRAGYVVEVLASGLKAAAKRDVVERVKSGQVQLLIGTHALIEDPVAFARLGLVIVDEQHRFGVMQRKRLIDKGSVEVPGQEAVADQKGVAGHEKIVPDVLVMTATPIPRTLSLTLYGDLDVSVIDRLPPGRTPVDTRWSAAEHLPGVWDFLRRQVAAGRQAYIVYPVIEQSKSEEARRSLKAAIVEYERLQKSVFPQLRLGLLHGRMRSDEKDQVMEAFRRGGIHILVSTTVIEVGVDVPNATVMVIEHAERFGLAQLHQLRGRIGRGAEKSTCILIAPKPLSGEGQERLETMVATNDGFAIAEMDLKLRGPGEFFGTRQHGALGLDVANPLRDRQLLETARREAFALVDNPEAEVARRRLLGSLAPEWQRRYQLASVG